MLFYKRNNSDEELTEQLNETNSYKKRGEMYGYGLATYNIE